MHRKNPVKIEVQAPSRGLVTRWPSDTADKRNQGDLNRAFTVAENVRFDDGVVACAPGHERAGLDLASGLLTNLLAHWTLDEAMTQVRKDSVGSASFVEDGPSGDVITTVAGKFGNAFSSQGVSAMQMLTNAAPFIMGSSSFTVCGWINVTSGVNGMVFRFDSDHWQIDWAGLQMRFYANVSGSGLIPVTSSVTFSTGGWVFFAAVKTATTISIRVNGTTTTVGIGSATLVGSPTLLQMSGGSTAVAAYDSISIWTRNLSSAELDTIYNSGTGLTYPFISGGWNASFQANLLATPSNPFLIGSTGRLYLGARTFAPNPRQYLLTLAEVYPGASGSALANGTPEFRWSFSNFLDKVAAVQHDIVPQYYITGDTRDISGLPVGNKYDGCESFFNHLLLWKDQTLKWSALADITTWIPIATSPSTIVLTLSSNVAQPAAGALATVSGGSDNWLPVTEITTGLTVGQFVRIDDTQSGLPKYNFYTVDSVSPAGGLSATSVTGTQSAAGNTTTLIFVMAQTNWAVGQRVVIAPSATVLTVASASPVSLVYFSLDTDFTVSGGTIQLDGTNLGLAAGEYISIGTSLDAGQDIYLIAGVTSSVPGKTNLTLTRQNFGTGAGNASYLKGAYVVRQPWVKLTNSVVGAVAVATSSAITEVYAVKLRLQDLTGRTATAATIVSGKKIVGMGANEAGEGVIVGAEDNGPIYKVIAMGEYARIFKNRSISVAQYVGTASGTFFIRTEVVNEGLASRESVVKLNDTRVVFLGNRELYDFQGGLSLKPVCMQYTRTLFEELDRGRINEVVLHHREPRNEVWVVYPVLGGGFKILIWNYIEDTATLDIYTDSSLILRNIGLVDWLTDPSWSVLPESLTWDGESATLIWDNYVGNGAERATVMLAGDGSVLIFGNVYNRSGAAYTAKAETIDFDFGDPSIFKYTDSLQLALQVKTSDNVPRKLYVQAGTRSNLDADIKWGAAVSVSESGNGQAMTKVNPGGAGRYLRFRFYSIDMDVPWRISGYVINARVGGSY